MTETFNTNAEKYLYSRNHFRKVAQDEFLRFNEHMNDLVTSVNELVSSMTLFTSGKSLTAIPNGLYLGDLMVSFCRSHFISTDLTLGGELIEAATIIRKQMELLSRLNELRNGLDINKLLRRTPNLKHLKTNLNRLYSDYSEIAHSSNPQPLQLLGRIESNNKTLTPLYPVFQENSYASMQHIVLCALEFYVWASDFYTEYFSEYDPQYNVILFKYALEKHEMIFLK